MEGDTGSFLTATDIRCTMRTFCESRSQEWECRLDVNICADELCFPTFRTPSAPRPPMSAQGSARRSAHPPDSAPARVTQSQRSARSWRSEFSQAFTEQRPHTHRGVGSAGLVPPLKLPTEGHNAPRPTSSARSGRGTWRNETTHRRYNFTDANGRSSFANTPHGIAVSDARTPSLKHFDVICPQWVDNSVSESRTHVRCQLFTHCSAVHVLPVPGAEPDRVRTRGWSRPSCTTRTYSEQHL